MFENTGLEVLILVLMEYALGVAKFNQMSTKKLVLILVLMEYALGVERIMVNEGEQICLNPCSNGICSRSLNVMRIQQIADGS